MNESSTESFPLVSSRSTEMISSSSSTSASASASASASPLSGHSEEWKVNDSSNNSDSYFSIGDLESNRIPASPTIATGLGGGMYTFGRCWIKGIAAENQSLPHLIKINSKIENKIDHQEMDSGGNKVNNDDSFSPSVISASTSKPSSLLSSSILSSSSLPFRNLIISLSCGSSFSLALNGLGIVWVWGDNKHGELGLGMAYYGRTISEPTEVHILSDHSIDRVNGISAGRFHSIATTSHGKIYSWGSNKYGQLGVGGGRHIRLEGGVGFAGAGETGAARKNPTSWKESFDVTSTNVTVPPSVHHLYHYLSPILVDSLSGVECKAAYAAKNGDFSVVIGAMPPMSAIIKPHTISSQSSSTISDNSHTLFGSAGIEMLFVFGSNSHGQLGLNDFDDRYLPTPLPFFYENEKAIYRISLGSRHVVVLTEDRLIYSWGDEEKGQTGRDRNIKTHQNHNSNNVKDQEGGQYRPQKVISKNDIVSDNESMDNKSSSSPMSTLYSAINSNSLHPTITVNDTSHDSAGTNSSNSINGNRLSSLNSVSTSTSYPNPTSSSVSSLLSWFKSSASYYSSAFSFQNDTKSSSDSFSIANRPNCQSVPLLLRTTWEINSKSHREVKEKEKEKEDKLVRTNNNYTDICGMVIIDDVICGSNHTFYIGLDRLTGLRCYVYASGDNSSGQLGVGDLNNRTIPTLLSDLTQQLVVSGCECSSIAAGNDFSLVSLRHSPSSLSYPTFICSTGSNQFGQLGIGSDEPSHLYFASIWKLQGEAILYMSCGHSHALVLKGADDILLTKEERRQKLLEDPKIKQILDNPKIKPFINTIINTQHNVKKQMEQQISANGYISIDNSVSKSADIESNIEVELAPPSIDLVDEEVLSGLELLILYGLLEPHRSFPFSSTKISAGDHIYRTGVYGTGLTHHGIYCGNDKVIHFNGAVNNIGAATIRTATLAEFACGHILFVQDYSMDTAIYSVNEVIARAESKLGESGYSLFSNNCESFSCWCKTGKKKSQQVEQAKSLIKGIGLAAPSAALALFNKVRTLMVTNSTSTAAAAAAAITAAEVGAEVSAVSVSSAAVSSSASAVSSSSVARAGITGVGMSMGARLLGFGSGLLANSVLEEYLSDSAPHLEESDRGDRRISKHLGTVAGVIAGAVGGGAITSSAAVVVAGLGAYTMARQWRYQNERELIKKEPLQLNDWIEFPLANISIDRKLMPKLAINKHKKWKNKQCNINKIDHSPDHNSQINLNNDSSTISLPITVTKAEEKTESTNNSDTEIEMANTQSGTLFSLDTLNNENNPVNNDKDNKNNTKISSAPEIIEVADAQDQSFNHRDNTSHGSHIPSNASSASSSSSSSSSSSPSVASWGSLFPSSWSKNSLISLPSSSLPSSNVPLNETTNGRSITESSRDSDLSSVSFFSSSSALQSQPSSYLSPSPSLNVSTYSSVDIPVAAAVSVPVTVPAAGTGNVTLPLHPPIATPVMRPIFQSSYRERNLPTSLSSPIPVVIPPLSLVAPVANKVIINSSSTTSLS